MKVWLITLALLAAGSRADVLPPEPDPDDGSSGASNAHAESLPHPLALAHPLSAVLIIGLVAGVAATVLSAFGFLPSRRKSVLLVDPTAKESLAPAAAELL